MKSLRTFLRDLIDYAGLFPPAALPMDEAVGNFAGYHGGEQTWILARFVVPAARLRELEAAAEGLLPGPGERPWQLSVLGGEDPRATAEALEALERRHPEGELVATAVEMKASSTEAIRRGLETLPEGVEVFFEIPHDRDPAPLLGSLTGTRGRGKIRSGGVTEDAFPSPEEMARFLRACRTAQVPFKATAGLHHPLRGRYPLTYEKGSPEGTMFGFLNVFAASAFLLHQDLSETELLGLLTETDPEALTFSPGGLRWRGRDLSLEELDRSRHGFALSYGSCSFVEPIEDLQAMDLL